MSAFTRWYLGKLQSHPMTTNLTSALLLMSAGDIFAQEVEIHGATNSPSKVEKEKSPLEPKLSFRRYGTLSPDVGSLRRQQQRDVEEFIEENQDPDHVLVFGDLFAALKYLPRTIHNEVETIDFFRTGTMAFWAVAFYTPYYVYLYRLFDRFLPMQVTPASVMSRVGLSFLSGIPNNGAFFCYGSLVHHFAEWMGLVEEWRHELIEQGVLDATLRDIVSEVPFDFDMAWSAARLKVETELPSTTITSAIVWIPINLVNFSVVPPHIRPLALMVCSAFWNAYLSLAQHRDASM